MTDILQQNALLQSYAPILRSIDKRDKTVVFSVANTQKLHLAAVSGRTLLYITDEEKVDKSVQLLQQLGVTAAAMPAPFDLLIPRHQANLSHVSMRLTVLLGLANGTLQAVVASPKALLQWMPVPAA